MIEDKKNKIMFVIGVSLIALGQVLSPILMYILCG